MKVLLISNSFGAYGGMEAFLIQLARFLKGQPRMQVRIVFRLLHGKTEQSSLSDSLEKNGLSADFIKDTDSFFALLPYARWADIVHAQNPSPYLIYPARLLRKKIFLTIHNQFSPHSFWKDFIHQHCRKIVNDYRYNSQFVQRTWEKNPLSSRVVFTASEIDCAWADFAERRGFICISRLIEGKGVGTLIKSYLASNIDKAAYPLTIIGEGEKRSAFEELARDCPHVVFTGFVDNETKYELLRKSRWLVAVPEQAEDMGLTPLEARSKGIPCLVSLTGGLPEVAGKEALLCPPNDVESLSHSLEKAADMTSPEYEERARSTFASVKEEIVSYEFYLQKYEELLA